MKLSPCIILIIAMLAVGMLSFQAGYDMGQIDAVVVEWYSENEMVIE
jgi:hypothetical protein